MKEFDYDISSFKLVTGGGGRFEVLVDGDLVFSKLETGRFPDAKEIKEAIASRLKQGSSA